MRTLFLSGQGRAMGSAAAQLIHASFQLPLKPCPLCPFRRVLGKCSSAIAPTCHHKLHYHLHGNVRKDMEALIGTSLGAVPEWFDCLINGRESLRD